MKLTRDQILEHLRSIATQAVAMQRTVESRPTVEDLSDEAVYQLCESCGDISDDLDKLSATLEAMDDAR